ncbi:cytidine deaminase-like isoform X1 [Bombus pascuorum]|uniref:cytidine deaminase-like isoform X1 n=1 Tax=Bombus pascuorum TaxID=65598 RepID=UPI002131C3D7|nr:cytidine deaminase-like isoform X1 [Bombus pascuorum]XP_060816084.1 cytidine deaminase-like isoform X1 [Bombus pascuorum]
MNTEEIIDFTDIEPDIQSLIRKSIAAREYSYSPYSKFKVGAGLLCSDGIIFTGCNVENASYPVGTCAERTAIVKAVSEGKRKFKVLAVVANKVNNIFTTPCGFCRQAIAEFGDIPIYLAEPLMKDVLKTSLSNLLPCAFGLGNAEILQ